ncbi:hypothetical protein PVK06_039884 [Gossypium arboreum]|uniref:Uncharacterized protein n=1 Tax=Gossypium arboreum TaxID=29729 RepID=A0ABR0N4P6_GOSAR|nr:hypothetical protein PVK06_039884 [Gossypium arboreum]
MTMEVGGEVETIRCVEPTPKVKEVSPNSELECQAVQVVSDHVTNKWYRDTSDGKLKGPKTRDIAILTSGNRDTYVKLGDT